MKIGIPREIKDHENRVAITPAGVKQLTIAGHQVLIECGAGLGSGLDDASYMECGATMLSEAADVWENSDMILKVKEPIASEYGYFREGLLLFTYLHLAADEQLLKALLDNKVTAIAYETVQLADESLPLLTPMSEIAGRMSVQIGARLLEEPSGGKGILLGGVPGVPPAEVVIIGGGVVGANAARIAVGLGARTTILDLNAKRLRVLDDLFSGRVATVMSNPYNISEAVARADLLVGAVLIPGLKAPRLVTEEMVKRMKRGSVIVDVAVDQGGSIETIDHATTHSAPTYDRHGIIHYSVANMPGAVPYTSTLALTNVTIPFARTLADTSVRDLLSNSIFSPIVRGMNTFQGFITHQGVANAFNLPYCSAAEI